MTAMPHNRIALVTGAARGIGAAVVQALSDQEARVAALDRDAGALADRWSDTPAVTPIVTDITDAAAVEATVQRVERDLGPIAILVNVAGILRLGPVQDLTAEDWVATFAVNTTGVFHVSRAVTRGMIQRRSGAVVTVSSNAAAVPRVHMAAYAASKAASTMFTRCLGLELADHGIRCNIVSPGSTDTDMQRQLWTDASGPDRVIAGSLEAHRLGIPLRRIATPEDIADAVVFLVSDRARHITLHDLRVDGGATLDA
ncbi:2,3-dihydroxybenzoate-2,3-dehydrogenase [Skermanella stibiiresistens SB22]|uniref:2,3-dihydro-2,3-dihydroxybenzoate dehydrogenase n=2 Tax=Skermanella TaxID=204447 RepID=W9H785_9PROT|nr:2,3-dihydroxybenzoate-2,3-dehydrogenase [Skermanella stibiiresistens SB22]